jgi:hypothetical protein
MTALADWGALPFRFPFLDMHAVLSAVECHRQGIDVYAENPCDELGRIHVYSPIWLLAAALPVTIAWTTVTGLTTVILFLMSLLLLPPGRGWWQTGAITLGAVSSVVAFAVERANIDLIVFVLAALSVWLSQQSRSLRLVSYSLALLAGLLKFYPAVLLILAVRERFRMLVVIGALSCEVVVCFVVLFSRDLARVLLLTPTFPYINYLSFGARDLPYGLAQAYGWTDSGASTLLFLLVGGLVFYAFRLSEGDDLQARLGALSAVESDFLLVGSALFLGCFFAGQNVLYRGVHLLFIMPGLTAMVRPPVLRRNGRLILGCVVVLMLLWAESIRIMVHMLLCHLGLPMDYIRAVMGHVWIVRQLMWWAAATMLAAFLMGLIRRSQLVHELSVCLPRRRRV